MSLRSTLRIASASDASEQARRWFIVEEGRGLLRCDWTEVVFIHYAAEPELLQPHVPVELDLWEGRAFVSLVAFTMRRFRPAFGGRFTAWQTRPFATQRFLNLRTYVRRDGERGIYFLKEWNSSRLCAWVAPWAYGLPYRFGTLDYRHAQGMCEGRGVVQCAPADFEFRYRCDKSEWEDCAPESLDEFLLERYLAFACADGPLRYFRVWHPLWSQRRVAGFHVNDALLRQTQAWWKHVAFAGANVSPGVTNVWMGRPRHAIRMV